ncbi:hypothetical protein HanPI659440_Chr11g0427021 [Helianthus annuus]|nr:hypothetical protein HanPI659440_Chr11g0427021 [Helianthus annuus]
MRVKLPRGPPVLLISTSAISSICWAWKFWIPSPNAVLELVPKPNSGMIP